jgi:hypothetical protein
MYFMPFALKVVLDVLRFNWDIDLRVTAISIGDFLHFRQLGMLSFTLLCASDMSPTRVLCPTSSCVPWCEGLLHLSLLCHLSLRP